MKIDVTKEPKTEVEEIMLAALHALTWSCPIGGETCDGEVTKQQADEWRDQAIEKLEDWLAR